MNPKTKYILGLLPIVLIAGIGILYLTILSPKDTANAAPDFSVKTIDGKTVTLADFKGKPLLLHFGASW